MSWFDPEKMVKSLISSLGVSPEDFIGFITMARNEFMEMRADRLAFKPASVKAYQDIMARMDRLETSIAELKELQRAWIIALTPETEKPAHEHDNRNGSTGGH